MLQNLYLSSTYLSISIGARIAAPKSKAFLLMNINIFVSIFNNFFPRPSIFNNFWGQPWVLQTQFIIVYVNKTKEHLQYMQITSFPI